MGRTCIVPGCKSGTYIDRSRRADLKLRQISVFTVPKNEERRSEWEKILGCKLETKHAVCQLHFEAKYIRKCEKITLIDGTIFESPHNRYGLARDAVPTLEHIPIDIENDSGPADKANQCRTEKETEVVECPPSTENSENVTTEMTEIPICSPTQFTINLLKEELKTAALPQSWAWTGKTFGITFTLLDPYNFHPRVQLEVAQDLSAQIRTITDTVIPLADPVTCMTDVYDYLKSLKNRPICKGTGIEEESRDHRCIGILDDNEEYLHARVQQRCTMCRIVRQKYQQRVRRSQLRCGDKKSRKKPPEKSKEIETKRSAKES
ncbi:uncharacterized protein [Venturia canescens]|uniref:uncharacterized protein n=1 Tax=Venturia canescens TaxID=32260 RepID=UPI001C9D48CF|nr:uncharacterized protein LOC122414025 [Venturia canescens]